MAGWIKLYRKITDNPVWDDKPFSKGQAWIDLILMANHNPTRLIYGNTIIELDRGQLHTSEPNLMKRWGWSKKKVRAYLLLLKKLEMATAKGTIKGTTITVENYPLYQSAGTEQDTDEDTLKEPQRNRKGTDKGKQTRSKEGEECKEPKEEKNIVPYPLEEFCFGSELEDQILIWLKYKTEKKEPYKPTGFKTLLSKIKQNADKYGNQEVIKLIDDCMAANWKGIIWDKLQSKPESKYKEVVMPKDWNFSDIDIGGEK